MSMNLRPIPSSAKRRTAIAAFIIALLTFVLYGTDIQNGFVDLDDGLYVVENVHIRSLDAAFFKWAFFDFYAANWHPLTWISHAVDYALWGLNPVGHHVMNMILHALNTFLVVVLCAGLLTVYRERKTDSGQSFLNDRTTLVAAAVTGLLFGIHPVHVESVAWTAERKDLLCALFFLLSVIAYTGHARRSEPDAEGGGFSIRFTKQYLAALGFFVLALLSKPMAVSLPVVLLILDWHPFGRIGSAKGLRSALFEKAPFIALSLASSVVTVFAQKSAGAIWSWEVIPLPLRLLIASRSLIGYLREMAWPSDLSPFYPYPADASLLSLASLVPILLLIGLTAVSVAQARKKRNTLLAVWSYHVVTLLPVIGIIQVGGQSMADRYTYLPSIGAFLLAGLAVAWLWEKTNIMKSRVANRIAVGAVVVAVCLLLSSLTVRQIPVWKDGLRLWSRVIEHEPERVPSAYYNLGTILANRGLLSEAIESFNRAIALQPGYYEAYNNRGIVYSRLGRNDKAEESFDQAIAAKPESADAFANRGLLYSITNQYEKALSDFDRAIRLDQTHVLAFYNRGMLFERIGRKELAFADLRRACELGDSKSCSEMQSLSGNR